MLPGPQPNRQGRFAPFSSRSASRPPSAMPWGLLSRFRRPVRRPHTSKTPPQDSSPQVREEPSAQQLPIARKILQDPNAFLEDTQDNSTPVGLTPSTRLPSGDGSGRVRSRTRPTGPPLDPLSERNELPPGSSVETSSRTLSRFTINRISKIAAGGEWSTFGRKREHRSIDPADFSGHTSPPDDPQTTSLSPSPTKEKDNKRLSADSVASLFTPSRITNPSAAQSSPGSGSARRSLDMRLGTSPTDTMSSKRHPRTPQGQSSYTTPVAVHAASSAMNLTTPVHRQASTDSPHTFGHPTPPDNHVEYPVVSSSPPPPLPPLDHPELAAALSSRRQSMATPQPPPPSSAFRDRSNTLPTSSRSPRKDDLFTSLSVKLARSVRHRSGLLEVKRDLAPAPAERHEPVPPDAPERRRRARTVSGGAPAPRRRSSADWSSYQASVGVNSQANQAWPAEVSREILRLSLGTSGPDNIPGSPGIRKQSTRGRSLVDPDRRPDRCALSPSFLPFPRPSPPNTPSPITASATLADSREVIPTRSHSLRFDLGSRGDGQPRARLSIADVKRSSSVIETRRRGPKNEAGGATYPSLGSNDPEAPQRLLYSSLAPTSSQPSLLSGRTSPANIPMADSILGEPSTPTPVSRQLSNKSRGKRKAEDAAIDVTPPEQKKEGQRATFLLPTGTRSQRVSGSSHAPSSYHRKRARLSATSPFATPAQSRPSSVHETPRSANRNRHFTSLSSATSARLAPSRTPSRAASTRSRQPPTPSTARKHERHQSMSQVSIPISAIISPHAPSISRSTKFHMRDPRRPPKKPNDTPWGLRLATEDELGSPLQAWCFFFGFLFFPLWWIAGLFLRIPKTRIAGDVAAEKGVTIDDPQIERDAIVWRFRCRVMAVVSLITYVPFIVLVAIYAPR